MKVAETTVFAVILGTVHTSAEGDGQLPHCTDVEVPVGIAVNMTVVPLTKPWLHVPALDAQLRPCGELLILPVPPKKSTVSVGPVVLRQATFAVIELLMIAPDEGRFPTL